MSAPVTVEATARRFESKQGVRPHRRSLGRGWMALAVGQTVVVLVE